MAVVVHVEEKNAIGINSNQPVFARISTKPLPQQDPFFVLCAPRKGWFYGLSRLSPDSNDETKHLFQAGLAASFMRLL